MSCVFVLFCYPFPLFAEVDMNKTPKMQPSIQGLVKVSGLENESLFAVARVTKQFCRQRTALALHPNPVLKLLSVAAGGEFFAFVQLCTALSCHLLPASPPLCPSDRHFNNSCVEKLTICLQKEEWEGAGMLFLSILPWGLN